MYGMVYNLFIWKSIVLSKYFEYSLSTYFENKNVLELGCGTGFVGLSTALLSIFVYI